ncbi:unnamed protein product [Nesidiocoris tenuis]|uniref:Reelin domain-containing protein n=1 Tax=Nesidiocoris tenuis TaxID=355587 RepID=A0A6H5H8G5_9HEMI|nr:unnamed protein product [Nesidiocoris tenuis]
MPVVLLPLHFDRDAALRAPSCQRSIVLRPFITEDFMTGVPAIPGEHIPVEIRLKIVVGHDRKIRSKARKTYLLYYICIAIEHAAKRATYSIALAVAAVLLVDIAEGYSKGAPKEVCDDMTPQHPATPQPKNTSPYLIKMNRNKIQAGESVNVTITVIRKIIDRRPGTGAVPGSTKLVQKARNVATIERPFKTSASGCCSLVHGVN